MESEMRGAVPTYTFFGFQLPCSFLEQKHLSANIGINAGRRSAQTR